MCWLTYMAIFNKRNIRQKQQQCQETRNGAWVMTLIECLLSEEVANKRKTTNIVPHLIRKDENTHIRGLNTKLVFNIRVLQSQNNS